MQTRKILILGTVLFTAMILMSSVRPTQDTIAQDNGDDDTCTTLLHDALQLVGSTCAEMGRNEACYGHNEIIATLQTESSGRFTSDGDTIDILDLQSVTTEFANPETGEWGVALMLVQADLPDASEATMTFVLFGDVEIESAVEDNVSLPTCTVSNEGTNNINIRSGTSTDSEIIGVFPAGSSGIANGRNDASDWLRIEQDGTLGWVFADLMTLDCDPETLSDIDENDLSPSFSTPMQAITLQSGQNQACESTLDGLMIRSPEGRRARIMVNGVELTFSSVGFLTAQAGGDMRVHGLEGEISATVDGVTEIVLPDTYTTIPLDANFEPTGPPDTPQSVPPSTINTTSDLMLDVLYENEIGFETCEVAATTDVNTRLGPGTDYGQSAELIAGQSRDVTGMATGTDGMVWWQIGSRWVRSDVITISGDCSRIPEISDIDPPPTTVPSSAGSGGSSGGGGGNQPFYFSVNVCSNEQGGIFPQTIPANTAIQAEMGMGSQTDEQGYNSYSYYTVTLTIDGASYGESHSREYDPASNGVHNLWNITGLASGQHTFSTTIYFTADWIAEQGNFTTAGTTWTNTCSVTIG